MVTPAIDELLCCAVDIIRSCPQLEDAEIVRRLNDMGIESAYGARLVLFLPIAYCRLLLRDTGARFSDSFCRMLPDGTISPEQTFSSEPLWNAAVSFAQREVARGIAADKLLSLAGRSAEFQAANSLLQKGCPIEDIAFTSPILKGI